MNTDVFPLLDIPEIVMCLQSCDFTLASEEDIAKPTSPYIMSLYEQIIKGFTGISTESYLSDKTRMLSDEEDHLFLPTLHIITLNKTCYKFFKDIGVNDFGMMDLKKPDYERNRRLLSAVVNYARFREERMFDCKKFISTMEILLNRLRSKFDDFNLLQQQTKDIQEQLGQYLKIDDINEIEIKIEEEYSGLETQNNELEIQLKKLTREQETFSIDYNNYRLNKQKLLKQLESSGYRLVELESKNEKLQKSLHTDMSKLNTDIEETSLTVKLKQHILDDLETKQSNLQISSKTYEDFINQLYDLLRILSTEIQESNRNEKTLLEIKQQLITNRENLQKLYSTSIMDKISTFDSQIKNHQLEFDNLLTKSERQNESFENNKKEITDQYNQIIEPKKEESEDYVNRILINGKIKDISTTIDKTKSEHEVQKQLLNNELCLFIDSIVEYMEDILRDAKVF